jgi:hypothetical protein
MVVVVCVWGGVPKHTPMVDKRSASRAGTPRDPLDASPPLGGIYLPQQVKCALHVCTERCFRRQTCRKRRFNPLLCHPGSHRDRGHGATDAVGTGPDAAAG